MTSHGADNKCCPVQMIQSFLSFRVKLRKSRTGAVSILSVRRLSCYFMIVNERFREKTNSDCHQNNI